MKKFLLAVAALATTMVGVNAADFVTPTGTRTEILMQGQVLTGVGRANTYDVTKTYDYYMDGTTIYIANFITGKGYFVGTLSDQTVITVNVPQALYEEDGVTYYLKTANLGGSGEALLDEKFTMTYYPANGRINTSYGLGVFAGDNTACEHGLTSISLSTDQSYSDSFELARIAETSDGQVYADKVVARYLDKKNSDYLAVEGMFPGQNCGQVIDDWGSKWRFTDSQYTGLDDNGAHTFTAVVASNGTLTSDRRNFTKTVNGDVTEWNMDEGQEIISWHITGNDDSGVTASPWRTVTSLKLTTDLSVLPATAIGQVDAANEATEVARYNLAGQRVNADTKGVVIVRMSDGTAHKVMVK